MFDTHNDDVAARLVVKAGYIVAATKINDYFPVIDQVLYWPESFRLHS